MPQITGKLKLNFNGVRLLTENNVTLDPGGIGRNTEAHGGRMYYTEEDRPAIVTVPALHDRDADITTLSQLRDGIAIIECDTGQTYIVRNACMVDPPALDGGKAPLTIHGDPAERV